MNSTNETTFSDENENFFRKIMIASEVISATFVVFGTLLNLWLLCAIATSADLRVRMRNKLIVSTCVLHLTECCIKIPLFLAMRLSNHYNCHYFSSYVNIVLILDFVSNWILVEMIGLYLCQIMDLKISASLTILGQRSVMISVLLLPWVASLITVPAMVHSDHWEKYGCFIPTSYELIKSLDSIVPLLLSIILLVVAIVKKRNRYRKGFSASNMQVELISRGPELDETSAYVVGLAVSIMCDTVSVVMHFIWLSFMMRFLAIQIENSRVIVMMLPWLLFKDIRTRMKTWRPWYRPSAGIDLTLTYGKGQDEP